MGNRPEGLIREAEEEEEEVDFFKLSYIESETFPYILPISIEENNVENRK
jgi:hypothetical protein